MAYKNATMHEAAKYLKKALDTDAKGRYAMDSDNERSSTEGEGRGQDVKIGGSMAKKEVRSVGGPVDPSGSHAGAITTHGLELVVQERAIAILQRQPLRSLNGSSSAEALR